MGVDADRSSHPLVANTLKSSPHMLLLTGPTLDSTFYGPVADALFLRRIVNINSFIISVLQKTMFTTTLWQLLRDTEPMGMPKCSNVHLGN